VSGFGVIIKRGPDGLTVSVDRAAWQKKVCASELPPSARLVALALSVYSDDSGAQGVWFSATDTAKVTGIRTLTTVNHYVRMLADAWYLHRSDDGAWYLTWPGELP
jgi:hypothetical protein